MTARLHTLPRKAIVVLAVAGALAAPVPTTAADPSAADLALAKTYIETKMSTEQRSLLEKLAKAEGKDAPRVLIELVGSKTLGEKTFEASEPAPAPPAEEKKDEKK